MANRNGEFVNPDELPVENVIIEVKDAGVVRSVPALDKYWVEEREIALYEKPPSFNDMVIGELESWKVKVQAYIEDLKWLLSLEYHRFWSTIIYHPQCMDSLVSFLQEGNPPYMPPHENEDVQELYGEVRRFVLIVFCRLITNKESKKEWMTKEYMSNLIYDRFIFTVPIMLDLCLMYGYDNMKLVSKIVCSVFELQPQYQKDAEAAFRFIKEAFKFVILQVNKNYDCPDPPNLPETFKGFGEIRRPGADAGRQTDRLTFGILRELVIHVVDTAMTVRMFLRARSGSGAALCQTGFVCSMVQIYEYGIPQFYEKLAELGEENSSASAEVEELIDLARAEMIDIFREILAGYKDAILAREGNTALQVEQYLTVMMDGLSEKLLIQDYHACYPVHEDLEILRQAYPDIDSVKTDFILQAIYSNLEEEVPQLSQNHYYQMNGHVETNNQSEPSTSIIGQSRESTPLDSQSEAEMEQALIKEVKDILPHLGEGFILKCLQYYAFSPSKVISAVLEDNLGEPLKGIDQTLPIIPEDPLDNYFLETGVQRLNVFDGDEFDIMTRDDVDLSRIHVGKKRSKYKDLTEMLNDKSEIKNRLDIYHKYSIICDEEERGLYSDEYDDTYDSDGPAPVERGPVGDTDIRRPGGPTMRRAPLNEPVEQEESEESEDETEEEKAGPSRNKLDFCMNPEVLRAKREASFQARRAKGKGPPPKNVDVTGKPRGQGQEKEVLVSRDKKEKHKSSRANHNRRQGAQWKRSQGMMPS